jgi:hypothetical protein
VEDRGLSPGAADGPRRLGPRRHLHTRYCAQAETLRPGNAAVVPHGISRRLVRMFDKPDVAFTEPDPYYPVRLHVITTDREQFGIGSGYGTANLLGSGPSDPARGAEFSYSCGHGFLPNSQLDGFYEGHWVEPDRRLEILLQRTGSDKVDRCQLRITQPLPFRAEACKAGRRRGNPVKSLEERV